MLKIHLARGRGGEGICQSDNKQRKDVSLRHRFGRILCVFGCLCLLVHDMYLATRLGTMKAAGLSPERAATDLGLRVIAQTFRFYNYRGNLSGKLSGEAGTDKNSDTKRSKK